MVAAQSTDPPPTNNQKFVPPPANQVKNHQCPTFKRMCFHKLNNLLENNAEKGWTGWTYCLCRVRETRIAMR